METIAGLFTIGILLAFAPVMVEMVRDWMITLRSRRCPYALAWLSVQ